jgi:hypothetical protein
MLAHEESTMKGFNMLEYWLKMVAISHSDSKGTRDKYKAYLQVSPPLIGKISDRARLLR